MHAGIAAREQDPRDGVRQSEMELSAPQHKHKGPSQHRMGLTLERFASAKKSGYNREQKRDKQFALNAKRVNKYRKLKRKLQQSAAQPEVRLHFLCRKPF